MAKGRKHMYDMIVNSRKYDSIYRGNFFLDIQPKKEDTIKIVVSTKIVNSLSEDMQNLASIMTKTIMEGLVDGRK